MRTHSKRRELPITTRIAYFIYQIAYHFALPLVGILALWRARKEPGHRHNLSHRWGLGPVGAKGWGLGICSIARRNERCASFSPRVSK